MYDFTVFVVHSMLMNDLDETALDKNSYEKLTMFVKIF